MKFTSVEEIFSHFNIELSQLPDNLQSLVAKLEKATKALSEMDEGTKNQLFPILIQTVEIIHEEVKALNLLPPVSESSKIDRQKQIDLEAKAKLFLLRKQQKR